MLDALGTFFQHLHFLVAQGHVVKHNEQMINVSPAGGEVNGVHDTICFLEQIQSLFVRFLFDEAVSTFIQLSKHNGNFIFGHPQFFVVMLVE